MVVANWPIRARDLPLLCYNTLFIYSKYSWKSLQWQKIIKLWMLDFACHGRRLPALATAATSEEGRVVSRRFPGGQTIFRERWKREAKVGLLLHCWQLPIAADFAELPESLQKKLVVIKNQNGFVTVAVNLSFRASFLRVNIFSRLPRTQTSLFQTCAQRKAGSRLYPSHGPLRFITSHSFRARLCHAKNEAPEEAV